MMLSHGSAYLMVVLLVQIFSSSGCPDQCQCFSRTTVVCSNENQSVFPLNISPEARELILLNQGLSQLHANLLTHSHSLRKLVILNAGLRSISDEAFSRMESLQELEISGNAEWLGLNQRTFSSLQNLTRLILNSDRLLAVPSAAFDWLRNLDTLELRGNALASLPEQIFHPLHQLTTLDLSFNQISRVPDGLLRNTSRLRRLSLQSNAISNLPEEVFFGLERLEELNLQNNLISCLTPGVFPSSLTKLMLKKNNLTHLDPRVFHNLLYTTQLDLSQNKLTEIPTGVLWSLISLESLDLSENQLTSLGGTPFKGLFNLKSIHLQKNHLTQLEGQLLKDQNDLQRLDLSYNNLTNIPKDLLTELNFGIMVTLGSNPWSCDCTLLSLFEWLKNHQRSLQDPLKIRCAAPHFLHGVNLVSLEEDALFCLRELPSSPRHKSLEVPGAEAIRCWLREEEGAAVVQCKVRGCSRLRFEAVYDINQSERVSREWPTPPGCPSGIGSDS
ncbi:hypothetical protein DNTS_004254 [Danionella cerebrum]|uniref:LRRCT domain-containing protein n=1 Tax=Danionella cerebrum TaxID=2873325 RepID=A0A553MNM3_9TELE|nr:hypothetical protein DNTS_004254 [Danionella translucida]